MKRFLLAILSVCCATLVYAQKPTQDVLYLKNGSVVKGTIMSWTGETVKIQTRDGSIFVYDSNDVESRKVEQVTKTVTGKKILDYPKHSFGVRAGALLSRVPSSDFVLNPQDHLVYTGDELTEPEYLQLNGGGFHIGGVYEVSLTKTNRWFFQTGLDLQYISTAKKKNLFAEDTWDWDDDNCWNFQNLTANSLFIDIPMMFSCKFPLGNGFGIYPSFGLTHTIGLYSRLSGEREKFEIDYNPWTDKTEYTSKTGGLQSFEEGFKGGLEPGAHSDLNPYARYSLNFRAELNFIIKKNIVLGVNTCVVLIDDNVDGLFSFDSAYRGNIGLSVGYNF